MKSFFIFFVAAEFLFFPVHGSGPGNSLNDSNSSAVNWHTDTSSGKQYVELNTTVSLYVNAIKMCRQVGGILPEPRNSEENDFLDGMGTTGSFYLGLTDTDSDGVWEWTSDGSTVAWTFWAGVGEPAGGTHYNCGAMNRGAPIMENKKKWNLVVCDEATTIPVPVVCEKTQHPHVRAPVRTRSKPKIQSQAQTQAQVSHSDNSTVENQDTSSVENQDTSTVANQETSTDENIVRSLVNAFAETNCDETTGLTSFPNGKDVCKYYRCLSGKLYHLSCDPGTHWVQEKEKCLPLEQGQSCKVSADQATNSKVCSATTQYFADGENKCKYYQCDHGTARHRDCPRGTMWSQKLNNCVGLDSGESCKYTYGCISVDSEPLHMDNDYDHCIYYVCYKGQMYELPCPTGTKWSQKNKQCIPLYDGESCTPKKGPCKTGLFGSHCSFRCHCQNDTEDCAKFTGHCKSGCKPGWTKESGCSKVCQDGSWGVHCAYRCNCKDPFEVCLKANGNCSSSGCAPGTTENSGCQAACPEGKYGDDCTQNCNCGGNSCFKDGSCSDCEPYDRNDPIPDEDIPDWALFQFEEQFGEEHSFEIIGDDPDEN